MIAPSTAQLRQQPGGVAARGFQVQPEIGWVPAQHRLAREGACVAHVPLLGQCTANASA